MTVLVGIAYRQNQLNRLMAMTGIGTNSTVRSTFDCPVLGSLPTHREPLPINELTHTIHGM